MKILTLIAIILVSSGVQAGRHTISSLPYTLPAHSADLWDTLYFVDQDTNTSSTLTWNPHPAGGMNQWGINFASTHHWRVLFANDTILFGGDSLMTQFAAINTGTRTSHHIEIGGVSSAKRGYLIVSCAAWTGNERLADLNLPQDTATPYNPTGIRIQAGQVKIHDMYIWITGYIQSSNEIYLPSAMEQGQCIFVQDGQGTEISNCELVNRTVVWYDRQDYPAAALRLHSPNAPIAPETLSTYVHDNVITSFGSHGIASLGSAGPVLIANNTITLDGRQAIENGPNQYWGLTHSACIILNAPSLGTKIHKNTLLAGSSFRGAQGILLINDDAFLSSHLSRGRIIIDSNIISSHNGRTAKYDWWNNMGNCIKLRNQPRYIDIFGNHMTYVCDDQIDPPDGNTEDAYMPQGSVFEYQTYEPYNGLQQYIAFHNNVCSTDVITNAPSSHYQVTPIRMMFESNTPGVQAYGGWTTYDPTFEIYNNRLVGRYNWAYEFGRYYDQTGPSMCNYVMVHDDTIRPTLWTDITGVYMGTAMPTGGESRHNIIRDAYFTNISPSEGYSYGINRATGSLTNLVDMTYQRTLNINVKSELNGRPISGATVDVYNGLDVLVASGITDAIGSYSPIVSYQFYSLSSPDVNYNNFRFNVVKSPTDNVNKLFAVAWNSYRDTVMMPNTLGDGMWPGAADIVEYRTTLEDRNRQRNLPGPKSQVLPLRGARQTISFLQWNSDVPNGDTMPQFIRVADGAQTERAHLWSARTYDCAGFSATDVPEAYYEAEFSLANGDTIVYAANRSCLYQNRAHIVRVRTSGVVSLIDTQNVLTGISGTYRPMGMPAYRGNRSIVIPIRASSAGGSSDDIRMLTSADNGTTWGAMTPGFTWSTASDKRVDGDEYIDGSIWFNGITAYMNPATSTGEFRTAVYNGTSWTMDNVYPARGYYSREYASVIQQTGMQHLLFSDTGATGQVSRVTHLYKPFGSGAWQTKTLYTATVHTGQAAGSQPLPVGLTLTTLTDGVRAFYCKQDSILYSREWLDTGWTTNETIVSTGRLLNMLTTCNTVSSIHGDRAYVQYMERYGTTGFRTVLTTILGDGSTGAVADPTGACCLSSGTCVTTTSADCVSQGGTYQGDGIVCDAGTCSAPVVTNAAEAITGNVKFEGNVRVE